MTSFADLAGPDPSPPKAKTFGDLAAAPGGLFLDLPASQRDQILADMKSRGVMNATFNGAPLDATVIPTRGPGIDVHVNPGPVDNSPAALAAQGFTAPQPQLVAPAPAAQTVPQAAAQSQPVALPTGSPFIDVGNFLARQGAEVGNTILGGYRGLASLATGGTMDQAADATHVAPIPVPAATPATGQLEAALASPYNPVNLIPEAARAGGEALADNGMPGAGAALTTAGVAAPLVFGPKAVQMGKGALEDALAARAASRAAPQAAIEPTLEAQLATPTSAAPAVAPTQAAPGSAATIQPIKLDFPDSAPSVTPGQSFSQADQLHRRQVLASVGIDNPRTSALIGDAKAAATDNQISKLDDPSGNYMRAALDSEKAALASNADSLVKATGGSEGLDQSALYSRGNTIVAPLDALKGYFDQQTAALYKAADERAQGVPTQLNNFRTVLGDDSQMTNADRVHLRSAVNSYAKQLGLVGEDGSVFSNAQQAETMRKFLGENWSPSNGRFVSKLKDALDQDVMSSAGEDVYGQARQLWKQRAATLDNPNGIAKIMDASGPEGINRAVPIDKIPDAVTAMAPDQFGHIIDTLKNVPSPIKPQADAALAEIKAQFANKVQQIGTSQAGQWNAKGVTKFLNNNAKRLTQVFAPEEIAKFQNLNEAGHILAKDQSYPGAAVQTHNLVQAGVAHALQVGGAGIGGLAGPVGAAVGGFLGNKAASALGEASSLRAVKKRFTPISEVGRSAP